MRKIFRKAILSLCILSMGLVFANCSTLGNFGKNIDSNTLTQIITALVTDLVGQKGTVYTFSGSGTAQQLVMRSDGQYNSAGDATNYKANMKVTTNNTFANLEIPAIKLKGCKMSIVTFYNLSMTTATNSTSLTVGDNTTADGTITIDGATYSVSNVYMETTVTNQKLTITMMSIYFGENNQYVMNLTYTGNGVTEQ